VYAKIYIDSAGLNLNIEKENAMPPKMVVDNAALIEMIKDKVPQTQIMEKFGFKTSTQLKVAYANALMETGQAPTLVSGRSKKTKAVDNQISINKRGSLIIPKDLVDSLGFEIDDAFEVRKSAAGLSLKKK
jgi:hypothetical protein